MSDTGWWARHGKRWFVKQDKETGSIRAESEKGDFTAAYRQTWEMWKESFGWKKEKTK